MLEKITQPWDSSFGTLNPPVIKSNGLIFLPGPRAMLMNDILPSQFTIPCSPHLPIHQILLIPSLPWIELLQFSEYIGFFFSFLYFSPVLSMPLSTFFIHKTMIYSLRLSSDTTSSWILTCSSSLTLGFSYEISHLHPVSCGHRAL